MSQKIYLPGLFPLLAAVCLIAGILSAVNRAGYQGIYLGDTESSRNGWEYEIRMDSGEVKQAVPKYTDEYNYILSDGEYNAVKICRVMTEDLAHAELKMNHAECGGIEVFLNDRLLYSDFQTTERDAYGYLLIGEEDIRDETGSVVVNLPEDYTGGKLTIITYFAKDLECRYAVVPHLQSDVTVISEAFAGTVPQALWLVFWGIMVLATAACCLLPIPDKIMRFKMAVLFFVYAVSFAASACRSSIGYYSGLWEDAYRVFEKVPFTMETAELAMLTVCAVVLLAAEIWTSRRKERKDLFRQILSFGFAGFAITALQNSSELVGGVLSYFPTVLFSIAGGQFVPVLKLCSSLIIYTVTFLTVTQFVLWCVKEWKKNSLLLERSRFARENYELVMEADEDSRRRNHEMRHHMETLYSLLGSGETEKAAEYLKKTMEETDRSAKLTYSGNIVVNSIVGSRLNQAKERGIDVRSHIHIPEKLEADDVDLSILLSNMLENAVESCMRMKDREKAFIRLEIRKKQKFLFIECENSVDIGEKLQDGQTTIKGDRKNHGFGLDAMRAVAEKYASIIQIERAPDRFTVRTNLCLSE